LSGPYLKFFAAVAGAIISMSPFISPGADPPGHSETETRDPSKTLGSPAPDDPVERVNPLIGTAAAEHTFPGATYPFGMVQLSPDTGGNKGFFLMGDWKWCAGYNYADSSILGFSHLHRSGMGVGGWGDILVMPTVGKLKIKPGKASDPDTGYRSRFSHERETARPGYYRVRLDDYGIEAELTVGPRSGFHRYTFPASDSSHVLIDLARGLGNLPLVNRVRIIGKDKITGTRTSTGLIPFFKVHFCAQFSQPFDSFGVWNGPVKEPGVRAAVGSKIGAFVNYRTQEGEAVLVKVGLSFTSEREACANLEQDIPEWNFDRVAEEAGRAWSRELGKVQVTPSPTDDPETTRQRVSAFYTALYHAFLFPATFSDADGSYSPIGNVPGRSKQAAGFVYYSDYSVWDTFRAQMPLLDLVQPERAGDMVRTLVTQYRDSGWLPAPNSFGNFHSEGMIGDPAAIVIFDAYLKGIRGFDADAAFRAMRKNAMWPAVNVIPLLEAGLGRWGNIPYRILGYVPADLTLSPKNPLFIVAYAFNEGVSRTLEYAYADFCVAGMAKATGHERDYQYFRRRAGNYRQVFDPKTGFMRGKSWTGRWIGGKKFDPTAYTAAYTEGNAWQWTWSVFHDVPGLVELMGGREKFNQKLDAFFAAGNQVKASALFSVHIGGMIGQYAHGNEPSHHIAYLYNFSGQPWKTQELARRIMDEFYKAEPDGLAGNEDMGQMSAWYVFSAMGIYPFCPGLYLIGSPLFARSELELKDGAKLIIVAEDVSFENKYIQSASLNGMPLNRPWISHAEISAGAVLHFRMGPEPNQEWGSAPEDAPPSGDRLTDLFPFSR